MAKYGFAINLHRCVGCRTCVIACKMENQIPAGVSRIEVYNGEGGTVYDRPTGVYPNLEYKWVPTPCQQCDNAPCIAACPYNARFHNEITNKVDKCDMCVHRKQDGLKTMCELCCPCRAITTGDLEDPESAISKILKEHETWVEKADAGTLPNVFYYRA